MKRVLIFTIFTICFHSYLYSQETIITDRPNVTDAVQLISPGTFQIEAGYMYQSLGSNSSFSTLPNLSFKYGVVDRLELRVLTNYQRVDIGNSETSGLSPITLSPKIGLTDQQEWLPRLSLATSVTFPDVGKEEFQTEKLNYGFRLLMESDKLFPMAASFGADWGDSGETTWAYTWTSGASISDEVGFFIEIYGNFANDIDSQHSVDGGITYLINNNLQADAIVGLPLNQFAPDYWFGFGLAWKTNLKN